MTPAVRAGLVDALAMPTYDLGAGHPFAPDRQKALFDLIDRMGLALPDERIVAPTASRAELELAHAADYIDMVEATSEPTHRPSTRADALRFGIGTADNPLAPNQHQAASAVVGATIQCVREVFAGQRRHAFNPTGGLHHAARSTASGFCIYNDLVVGARVAQQLGAERVLYVDFDVHHGDGVEFAFDRDPSVMTLSFHQSPKTLFPGTGRVTDRGFGDAIGSVVNMPFAPNTGDESWWHCVSTVLPAVMRQFRPDFLITQHGCDPHREDPLAQLRLTTAPMQRAAAMCRELAEEICDGRWVATGGGGYQPLRVLPRAWTMVWAEVSGRTLDDDLDSGWLEAWQGQSDQPLTATFADPPESPGALEREATVHNERTLAALVDQLTQ